MKQLITILVCIITFSAVAQPPDRKIRERIKSQKIAFITDKLDLTTEEAQKFWPVYNTYDDTTEQIRNEDLRAIRREMRENRDMSEKEADALLDRLINADNKMHQAKQKLVEDLKNVLPSRKIILLKAAEDEFNKKLLDRLKEFRDKRGR
ncbi:MAG: sensor of ECF-type sigma factor [Psychroserpens sp.]|nr:sensor of ECF-type sigma factor [Psychroserpens sp.]